MTPMWRWLVGCALIVSCGGDKPVKTAADEPSSPAPRRGGGPSIDAEVGALDPDAVREVFTTAHGEVEACFRSANDGLDFAVIGGDLEVVVRVKSDGSTRWVYPAASDVGHRGAERCVLDALGSKSWPKPQGGDEGIARTRLALDPPAARLAVAWSSDDLGSSRDKLMTRLRDCRTGTASLRLTMYVDPDGNVISAGASVSDESGMDAIDCAIEQTRSLSFASPGSYPAKVTIEVD